MDKGESRKMATAPSLSRGAWAAALSTPGRHVHQIFHKKHLTSLATTKPSASVFFSAQESRNEVQGKERTHELLAHPSPGCLLSASFCQLAAVKEDGASSDYITFSKPWFGALNIALTLSKIHLKVNSEQKGHTVLGFIEPIPEKNDELWSLLFTGQQVITVCLSTGVLGTAVSDLSENIVFMSAFWSWLVAQTMKYFTAFYREGKWDWRVMFDSGGMPSSHTSLVVGLTTAIGYQYGLGSTMFPLSLAFSLIVMYDAAGVRRHAGKQAEVLNRILDDMFHGESISEKKLKEVLGHSPLQVLAGAVLGVFIAVLYAHKFGSGYASLSC